MKKHPIYLINTFFLLLGIGCTTPTDSPENTPPSVNLETIIKACHQGLKAKKLATSIPAFEEGYTLFQKLADSALTQYPFLDSLFFPLANQYKSIGETIKARELYAAALTKLAFTENDSALLYNQIGLTSKIEGNITKAIEAYQKGLVIPNINASSKGYLLSNLAIANLAIGKLDSLETYCDQAIDLLATDNTIASKNAIANMYKTKGQGYFSRGQLKLANQSIHEGLRYAEGRTKSKIAVDKGKLLNTMGQLEESLAAFNFSLQLIVPSFQPTKGIDNPTTQALYPENILIEALEGKAETYATYYQLSQDIKWLEVQLIAYEKIYKVERMMWQLHQYDASKQNLQQEIRRKLEKALAIVYKLVQHYYYIDKEKTNGYIQKAFEIAEQTKSMTLLGVVRKSKAEKFGLPEEQQQKEKNLSAIMRKEELNLDSNNPQIKQKYQQFIRQLEKEYPAYYQLKYDDQVIPIVTIQDSLLTENQALVEYVSTTDALYNFIIRKDTVILYRIEQANQENLALLTKNMTQNGLLAYQDSIKKSLTAATPAKQTYILSANQLYKYLLPWSPDFKGIDKLIIIPDGILGYLPFDALLTNRIDTTFNALPYLIRKKEINYSYSATLLQEMHTRKNEPSKTFLGFAPKFQQELIPLTNTRLAPLNLNKKEIASLKIIIGKGDLLKDKQATNINFDKMATDYRLLHFSTHGFANDQRGEDSWIALTPSTPAIQHSLLLTKTLYNYTLNADFVSLSACETALGELVNAEGIIGMTRAFSYAGAKSMMTTLWRVDEHNATAITIDFYTNLKGNGTNPPLTKSKALQQAKLDFINTTLNPHPFKWAGHILIGDNRLVF